MIDRSIFPTDPSDPRASVGARATLRWLAESIGSQLVTNLFRKDVTALVFQADRQERSFPPENLKVRLWVRSPAVANSLAKYHERITTILRDAFLEQSEIFLTECIVEVDPSL